MEAPDMDVFAQAHPPESSDEENEPMTLSLNDVPALPADVRLRVLATALDPHAAPPPEDLVPVETVDEFAAPPEAEPPPDEPDGPDPVDDVAIDATDPPDPGPEYPADDVW
jgi:hypothetical protein